MDQSPLPTSLAEVEELILGLFEPGRSPADIASIQETLQRLQKSPGGWQLAQSLLDRPIKCASDVRIKFFGALTIIVKLNTESSALSDDDARELLQNLIRWLISSTNDGDGALATQKLCHALVTYFVHFSHLWPHCVRHLLLCFQAGRNLTTEELHTAPGVTQLASGLDWRSLRSVLWFANTLVEDVAKTDMNTAKYMGTHDRLGQNAEDVAGILQFGLTAELPDPGGLAIMRQEALKGLQAWILYAQRVPSTTNTLIGPLRTLVDPVIRCVADDQLYTAAAELLVDVLSNYPRFFTKSHYDSIASLFESNWAQERYHQLVQGDFDFESNLFGLFMLAYGDAKMIDLMDSDGEQQRKFLSGLCGLLAAAGYPVAEDTIFVPALEFWSAFVETMMDNWYSEEAGQPDWTRPVLSIVMQAVGNCWKKVQYPTVEVFMSWESDERVGFGDARKDVGDLLQSVYTLSGSRLVSFFVDLLLKSIPTRSWAELEAAAFCLTALADCFSYESHNDHLLGKVFASPLFDLLALGEAHLPVRLRQTGLSLIGRYSEYFERHSEHLPAALNLLFGAVGSATLSEPSSRSILTLCCCCRLLLTAEVGAFLDQYQVLHANPDLDPLAEERLVTAISSIIQAIDDEGRRLAVLERLLGLVKHDIERCLQLPSQGGVAHPADPFFAKGIKQCQKDGQPISTENVLLQLVLRSLRCLANMARGLQATTDLVDLEAAGRDLTAPKSGNLTRAQNEITTMMVQVRSAFPTSGEVMDTICSILKAGFTENEPGPFVFPPDTVSEFFTQHNCQTPRIGAVVSTASAFISSIRCYPLSQIEQNLARLLPWVVSLLQSLPEPEADTELAQNGIEFVYRLMAKNLNVLMELQPTASLEFFFLFTLKVLNGREPLPKQTAAEFWTRFLALDPVDAAFKESISNAMGHLGPLIAQALMQNIGGEASRSDLDKLSEPLKKLVVQHVDAKAWLEHALAGASFPSSRVSAQEKSVFLKKVLSLRGSRQTNQVVREFWLACRGSNFAYAS